MKRTIIFLCVTLLTALSASAQIKVTGIITDAKNGEPIPFASVVVKNTTTGTSADADGNYAITAPSANSVLVFSSVGYLTQEVENAGRTVINVMLAADAQSIDETIVVAYGTVKKSSYTGSASVVSEEVMTERPYASFTDALTSNMPGLMSYGGAQPGSMPNIRVRGFGSMNASLAPLYVIDGIAVDMSDLAELGNHSVSPMTSINPSDIESITVLKDAASAALYGSRAANGVILITTKQGKAGKMKVDVSVVTGISDFMYKPDLVNAEEYAEIWTLAKMHNLMYNDGKKAKEDPYGYVVKMYADQSKYDTYLQSARDAFNKKYVQDGTVYDFWGDTKDKFSNSNWLDAVSRLGTTQKYNISISGGTFSSDPHDYLASGKSSEKVKLTDSYSVIDTENLRSQLSYLISYILWTWNTQAHRPPIRNTLPDIAAICKSFL